jgi:hypothetical protein
LQKAPSKAQKPFLQIAFPAQQAPGTLHVSPSTGHGAEIPGNGTGHVAPELELATTDCPTPVELDAMVALDDVTLGFSDPPAPPVPFVAAGSTTTFPPHAASITIQASKHRCMPFS